jgi:3-oxoacyl-[acyl-carrier protein] reductase
MTTPRVAIVTGAARGIGAATAARLAQDGHAVAILDLNMDACADTIAAVEQLGAKAYAVAADVSDSAAVHTAVADVVNSLGEPTILVNNAGVTRDNLLLKMSEQDWDTVMNVHLRGSFLLSRAVQPYMLAARWGRIINVSSVSALGNRGQANYAAAKAGLQGLTKTLALELGRFNVTVNAVAPGFIATDMTRETAARLHMTWEAFEREGAAQIPVGRVGRPDDVAHVCAFLADDASDFVSGQVIYVAGGPKS